MQSGVDPSLHPNCHHQIIFSKINLKIYYPTPYEHLGCTIIITIFISLDKASQVDLFDLEKAFSNLEANK